MNNKWKKYENNKHVYIITFTVIVITLLLLIGSLLIYLFVNGYFDDNSSKGGIKIKDTNGNVITTEDTSKVITTVNPEDVSISTTTTITTEALKYKVVDTPSLDNYALDEWEASIVNLLNNYRTENGVRELKHAEELRAKAEDMANDYDNHLKDTGLKYIIYKDDNIGYSTGYKELYEYAINKIDFKNNRRIEWVGVGVVFKNNTHYFCLIYE